MPDDACLTRLSLQVKNCSLEPESRFLRVSSAWHLLSANKDNETAEEYSSYRPYCGN